jgi:uncharacterized membrane protein YraQ (UPF0718 family)
MGPIPALLLAGQACSAHFFLVVLQIQTRPPAAMYAGLAHVGFAHFPLCVRAFFDKLLSESARSTK